MPKLSQMAESSVSAIATKLGFGSAKRSILRYVEAADGGDLSLAYDRAIAAGARTLWIPEGSYTWSSPKNYVQGLKIVGDEEIKTSGVGGAKINAPNGFLKNDNTTRKQIILKNLHIIGSDTAATVGIDGPFGGLIQGCRIQSYPDLIRNLSGYLCTYRRVSFDDAERGINTADANGTMIDDCHFDASVLTQVTSRDGTPQSGTAAGLPWTVKNCNFNMGNDTLVCLKVRGQLDISDNYFEDFGTIVVAKTFIDLEVNRFDLMGGVIENNVINGQGNGATAIYINGSHLNLNNKWNGYIRTNYIIGCAKDVVYGPNNRIPGLKIVNHDSLAVENSYKNQHVSEEEAWTYVRLASDVSNSTTTSANITGLGFTPEVDATYIVEGTLMLRSAAATTAPQPGIVWPTNVGDGVYYTQQAASANSTLPRYGNTSATFNSGAIDIGDATGSWPHKLEVTFLTGPTTTGDFQLTIRSEVAASNVTVRAGSWIRYRRIE